MRVLFLEIETEREWAVASIGPAFLAAFVRARGHGVDVLRVGCDEPLPTVVARVAELSPDILALSLTTRQWLRARDVVAAIRRELDIPVVAGGLHPTFSAESVLAHPGFDFVCLGEGEEPFADLLASGADPKVAIDNIWRRGQARPALRKPFAELDDLPFLARDLLEEPPGIVHMTTQRGCPFPCTYCAARNYDELYGDDYGRRRSHENVLRELETIAKSSGLNYVIFLDDTFTIHRAWVIDFCRLYRRRFHVPFTIHARIETMDDTVIDALADAGCRHVVFGIESGSFRVRREVMLRPVTNARMVDVFRRTREAGMLVTANYMLGLPGETRAEAEETLALHADLAPDDFGYFVFYPYPGTRLFQVCRERGYLPDDWLERPATHRESILTLPDLSHDDIKELYERFTDLRAAGRGAGAEAARDLAALG